MVSISAGEALNPPTMNMSLIRAGGQPGLDEYAEFKTVIVYKSGDRV